MKMGDGNWSFASASDSEVLFCSVHRYDRGKYYPTGPLGNFTSHGVGEGAGGQKARVACEL